MQPNTSLSNQQNNINLKEEVFKYLSQWKWFVVGVIFMISCAYLYLRYSIPQYKTTAKILVKDDRKGGIASELAAFSDLGLLSNVKSNVDNEIEVIKSRGIIEETVNELELDFIYLNIGRVKSEELYKTSPVKLVFLNQVDEFRHKSHYYRVKSNSDKEFTIFDDLDNAIGTFSFEHPFLIEGQKVILLKTEHYKEKNEFNIGVQILPLRQVVESLKSRLSVSTLNKYSSVIELSLIDPVKKKAEDFLNTLVINYNEDAVNDKKYVAENTSKFIEKRLELITEELKNVEEDVEKFKKDNRVTDIVSEAGLYLENASEFEKKDIENETQLKVVESMISYIQSNQIEIIPSNIIPAEEGASTQIIEYNALVLQRNKLLKTAAEKNVLVQNIDAKINALKTSIGESLKQLRSNLVIRQKDLKRQNAILNGKISQIPTQEKVYKDIFRKQNVKEALYLYLLEKREETAISLAVTAPNAKVIDAALASSSPVSPNRKIIYLAAVFVGLLIPFSGVYIINLFDTKVKSRVDIEGKLSMPFLGEVPKMEGNNLIVQASDRSSTAEAIRIVRTNLEFLLNGKNEGTAKTIFFTSTYPKEGKTFISVNTASIIAHSNKKVLLIGLDVRNPKLEEYLKVPGKGVANYLFDKSITSVKDLIVSCEGISNLDILPSGVIPPNPAELLMNDRLATMFEDVKKEYDYIIVDTAPVSLVTDTLIVAKHADAFVYVARANYLDKRMLELPQKLYTENKLPNMAVLLNDTDAKKGYGYGYGYRYGYGVEVKKKSFWKK